MSDTIAVIAGKLSAKAIRLLGAGLGSNVPGRVGQAISPSLLGSLSRQSRLGALAVSGTNGKSTTSGFVSSVMTGAGLRIAHNRQGANLVAGITASLIDAANWQGKLDVDYCLFEIDEAALPLVAKEVNISTVAVTNLFRDQLDRFGELDTTALLINRGIAVNSSRAILNADDPNVAQLGVGVERIYYGVASMMPESASGQSAPGTTAVEAGLLELAYCSVCASEYAYDQYFYGQLGHYFCRSCGHKRPEPQVTASNVRVEAGGSQFILAYGGVSVGVKITLPGMFNVYNALCAAALSLSIGLTLEQVRSGLQSYSTLFGRSERLQLDGKSALIQLIKNPAGASQAVLAAANDPGSRILISINDNYADGRDVSWLWDVEFEYLRQHGKPVFVSGSRCHDMAVRLKYAGLSVENIKVVPDLDQALTAALAATEVSETLWVLPTYTCLLQLQKITRVHGQVLSGT